MFGRSVLNERCAAIVCVCLFALSAWSQSAVRSFGPVDFVRLHSMEDLRDGDMLLIGAEYEREQGFYLMTTAPLKNKMRAERVAEEAPAKLSGESAAQVWYYRQGEDGLFALQTLDGEYLSEVDNTNIKLSESRKPVWNAEVASDGTFRLWHKSTPDRFVGFYYTLSAGKPAPYFGNYLPNGCDSYALFLYRQMRADEYRGVATMPENGARVTLYARGFAAMSGSPAGTLASFNADSCELQNGLFAPDGKMQVWKCRHGGAEGTFRLLFSDDTYLANGLQRADTPFDWCIADGHIVPAGAVGGGEDGQDALRRIYFSPSEQKFCQLTAEEALLQGAAAVEFKAVGESPFSEYDPVTRKKTLTGAWSASMLRTIGWHGVGSLDLTMLSLPVLATEFAYRPEKSNAPVYVSAGAEEAVPDTWNFVVVKGRDGELALWRKTVLADKQPFLPSYAFSVPDGILLYEREVFTDGNWETICIPFDSPVPNGFQAEVLSEIREGELIFSQTEKLEAYVPAIIRYVGNKTTGTVTLTCRSEAGYVESPRQALTLTGVFDTLQVADAAEAVYMLEESGKKFVKAAAGSRLLPFRAYIQEADGNLAGVQTLAVLHWADIEAGVEQTENVSGNSCMHPCYDLHGRKIADRMSADMWRALQPGVYIVGGKKTIKHK